MKHVNIKSVTDLHNDALRGIDFYAEELGILQERLQEIAAANTATPVLMEVEHFQDELIIHSRQLNELRAAFKKNHHRMEQQLLELAGFADEATFVENEDLYERYITEEKMVNELRHDFNRFASKWL